MSKELKTVVAIAAVITVIGMGYSIYKMTKQEVLDLDEEEEDIEEDDEYYE